MKPTAPSALVSGGDFAFVRGRELGHTLHGSALRLMPTVSAPNESKEASFSEILILFCFCFRVSAKTPLPADGSCA
jgi:hypothetical protein